MIDRETHRFGYARFGILQEAKRAGMLRRKGPRLGFLQDRPLRLEEDSPLVDVAGSGSGKGRDCLIYNACTYAGRMLINDPKGELAAVSIHNQINLGKSAYCINPLGLAGLPMHAVNPLDILKPDSASFHADVKLIMEMLIKLSGASSSEFFELRARDWCEALMKWQVLKYGAITLPQFFSLLNTIEADPHEWADISRDMMQSDLEEVRRTAAEMAYKKDNARGEYSGIMGTVFKNLGFLSDPALSACLGASDFSLEVLCDKSQPCNIYLNVPAEYIGVWSSFLRLVIGVAMLYKARHIGSPRVTFIVDEAGQLGNFEALMRGMTYGRGAGIRTWAFFQDTGQIVRNYGREALQGFLGSAQTRQFFGVRDLETATMVSQMLGNQTLAYDDTLQQLRDRHAAQAAAMGLLDGADPLMAGLQAGYHERASRHRSVQQRPLMTPTEIMNMPEDRQLLFISGKNCPPLYAEKHPYWTQKDMAGTYLANPYHPPVDRVSVQTWRGAVNKPVITEKVPARLAHWPQYASGLWSYVKGYKPNVNGIRTFAGPPLSGPEEKQLALPPGEFLYLPDHSS